MNKKTLYLVRHAKSSWKDASLADMDRPLNKRGRRNSPEMGRRLAAQGHVPDLIISSPANRAITTARNIAFELDLDESEIVTDKDLYFSGTTGMLDVLETVEDHYDTVMMVGHNPTMTSLLNTLAGTDVWNMPTCAIAIIGFDMTSWANVRGTTGDLLGYGIPKGPESFSD